MTSRTTVPLGFLVTDKKNPILRSVGTYLFLWVGVDVLYVPTHGDYCAKTSRKWHVRLWVEVGVRRKEKRRRKHDFFAFTLACFVEKIALDYEQNNIYERINHSIPALPSRNRIEATPHLVRLLRRIASKKYGISWVDILSIFQSFIYRIAHILLYIHTQIFDFEFHPLLLSSSHTYTILPCTHSLGFLPPYAAKLMWESPTPLKSGWKRIWLARERERHLLLSNPTRQKNNTLWGMVT